MCSTSRRSQMLAASLRLWPRAFQQAFLSHLLLEGFVCVQEHASQHIHIFTASDSASLWSRKYKHAI